MRNIKTGIVRGAFLMAALTGAFITTGCSRASINYQIAESIGTVGVYENNEPVETPKMKAEREYKEQLEAEENAFTELLARAKSYADSYDYESAIELLEKAERTDSIQERLEQALEEYRSVQSSLTAYTGSIPHLCFSVLIADTTMAFDGDAMASTYANNMITVQEFESILNCLYINDYVLVDLTKVVCETTDNRGVRMMEMQEILLPPGKKPVIISQDNLNYSGITNGDGIPTRLVLDDQGDIKAVYTDREGHDLVGDYDVIPVLNAFIEEHPDFSYRGAKGIVSVSGSQGMFGYDTKESVFTAESGKREEAKKIAYALKADGWKIACAGYDHNLMFNQMSLDQMKTALETWTEEIGSLTGDTAILFYPYGGEVQYPSEALTYLTESGYQYLCPLWSEDDMLELSDDYIRQTRRFVDGYSLTNSASNFSNFFAIQSVLDSDR